MSWNQRILATVQPGDDLFGPVARLLSHQRTAWEDFRTGEQALQTHRSKLLMHEGKEIVLKVNPRRTTSITANVDNISIAQRACFLCEANMPPEERGIAYQDFVLAPNPYPVHPTHLTIPTREHGPQRLAGRIANLLELCRSLGPNMLVFYNGPRCGASAPDHFHFQACTSSGVPLLRQIADRARPDGIVPYAHFGRNLLICRSPGADQAAYQLEHLIEMLAKLDPAEDEPRLNLVCTFRDQGYLAIVFPRARHRPACFYAQGDDHIAISPAALEMAGLVMLAEPEHLERLDADKLRSIYMEVSLDEARFTRVVEALT